MDIEDYFEPVEVYEGDEVHEEDVIRLSGEQDLNLEEKGSYIHLTDANGNILFEFKYVRDSKFGKIYVCTKATPLD